MSETAATGTDWAAVAADLDARDPLGRFTDRFEPAEGLQAYLDGNSLGRPVRGTAHELARFVEQDWGTRLIRGWDEAWMRWPEETGDLVASAALGAAPGQTVVADSTTVMLYKMLRALADGQVAADPARTQIVIDTDNFPTDRYVAEGVAAERGLELVWIEADPASGVSAEQVAEVVGERTGVVLLSHVAYRSGYLADAPEITRLVHAVGGLALWDLCHSAGSVPVELDAWEVDAAVGCTYKYLNGGPGAPAFAYLARRHHGILRQPIQGWMGRRDPFLMGPGYEPAPGIRSLVSGTPPVVAMVPLRLSLEMLAEAGIAAVRTKSLALTDLAWQIVESWPGALDVAIASPREHERRGGHLTIRRHDFADLTARLWQQGVIPDFRAPDGLRLGLAPLSTSFAEVATGLETIRSLLHARG
ncbi:aminotransferase class V-fold PLP-dependent enzyme [Ornithinimicrobium ciconiae]|uniref:Kynureninase n=1 Tax=Ornithinimicrobium ciconiae TaxID=2594265 RepID=A0A516GCL4_9MICO|nr:aminotransferase class V-fold PLP-dependent enzyme [Ornithinimicrobium ciconiae]QDO89237.1 aminotransferase class V-fold PLP-dependent enzyme [Ornithinimicrobium ciconiae]